MCVFQVYLPRCSRNSVFSIAAIFLGPRRERRFNYPQIERCSPFICSYPFAGHAFVQPERKKHRHQSPTQGLSSQSRVTHLGKHCGLLTAGSARPEEMGARAPWGWEVALHEDPIRSRPQASAVSSPRGHAPSLWLPPCELGTRSRVLQV